MNGYDKFFKEARKSSGAPVGKRLASPSQNSESNHKSSQAQGKGRTKARALTPEDNLRRELASRMANRKKQIQRRKQGFPVGPSIIIVIALVAATIGYLKPETIDFITEHVDIGAFGQARASDKAPAKKVDAKAEHSAGPGKAHSAESAEVAPLAKGELAPVNKNYSEEELSFFKKLSQRKEELDLREAELGKLEEELQRQKAELDGKIQQLETMRAQISDTLKTRVANDQKKVDKLVEFYSSMKPQQAAKIIESLNEDLAVEVLDKMKKKSAAEIMNMINAKKAQRLSELITGYQRTGSAENDNRAPASAADTGSKEGE